MQRQSLRSFTIFTFLSLWAVCTLNAQPFAYVSNVSGNSISVVNTSSNSVVGTVPVPNGPTGLAVTPDGSTLYVACQGANVVSVINTSNNTVTASINVGAIPTQLAINPNGKQVYVISQSSNEVSVIDTASRSVVGTVAVGARPTSIAFNPSGTRVFVANLWSGNVSVIDAASKTLVKTFSADSGPSGVVVTPDGRFVYVTNQYSGTVTVHDLTGTLIKTINGVSFPNSIAVTPNGSRIFVTNGNSAAVSIIDTASNTVVGNPAVQSLPTSVAVHPDGSRAYVTNEYGFSLSIIDTNSGSVMNTIGRVGVYPIAVAMVPAATTVVVAPPPPDPPPAPVCDPAVSAVSPSYSLAGGTETVAVTVPSGCGWTASTTASWIGITGGANGSGEGKVTYVVAANTSIGSRSGVLTIAGKTFTITQSGVVCSYTLSSAGGLMTAAGGTASVNITSPAGCAWSVSSDSNWLTLTSAAAGTGNAVVTYSAAANSSIALRTGVINAGGQTFTVAQSGASFSPIRVNCGGTGATDSAGNQWTPDDQRSRSITTAPIANTKDPGLYQKESWSTGTLQYQFTVPNGSFTVKLHFAEIYLTQAGQRVFDIVINGTTVLPRFDILAQTAPNTANIQTFNVNVTSGQLTIQLVPVTGSPKLAGLEIM